MLSFNGVSVIFLRLGLAAAPLWPRNDALGTGGFDRLPQFDHRHRVIAAPVVAGDGVEVFRANHIAGGVIAVEEFDQGHWPRVLLGLLG